MKKEDIIGRILSGCKLKCVIGTRKDFYYIQDKVLSCSYIPITKSQYNNGSNMCNRTYIETPGLTTHYKWLENEDI